MVRRISVCAWANPMLAMATQATGVRLNFYELQFLGAVKRNNIRRVNRVYPSPLLAQGP